MTNRQHRILLVARNRVAARAVGQGLRERQLDNEMLHLPSAMEALEHLHTRAEEADRTVMLLDFDTPNMGGVDFVEHIRQDPRFARLNIFLLTRDRDEEARANACGLDVSGCIEQWSDFDRFVEALQILDSTPSEAAPSAQPR